MAPPLKVAVIGAGVSGLVAARALKSEGHQLWFSRNQANLVALGCTIRESSPILWALTQVEKLYMAAYTSHFAPISRGNLWGS